MVKSSAPKITRVYTPDEIFSRAGDWEYSSLLLYRDLDATLTRDNKIMNEFLASIPPDQLKKGIDASSLPVFTAGAVIPYFATSAFAAELYLKCLYFMEKGNTAKKIHELDELFNKLTRRSQRRIKELFVEESRLRPGLRGKPAFSRKRKYSFRYLLSEASRAFEDWRYAHEGWIFNKTYIIAPIAASARRVILELKPEWSLKLDPSLRIPSTSQVH